MEHPLSDHPDRVIEIPATQCMQCGQDLSGVEPTSTIRRQVTELRPIQPIVIETRQDQVVCPCCGHLEQGALPEGLEALHDVFGVDISQGGQASIVKCPDLPWAVDLGKKHLVSSYCHETSAVGALRPLAR
jgi:hypothetical protein